MTDERQSKLEQKFLTVAEIAERLNVSTRTVQRFIAAGGLPVHRFGRSVRISETDFQELLAKCRSRMS